MTASVAAHAAVVALLVMTWKEDIKVEGGTRSALVAINLSGQEGGPGPKAMDPLMANDPASTPPPAPAQTGTIPVQPQPRSLPEAVSPSAPQKEALQADNAGGGQGRIGPGNAAATTQSVPAATPVPVPVRAMTAPAPSIALAVAAVPPSRGSGRPEPAGGINGTGGAGGGRTGMAGNAATSNYKGKLYQHLTRYKQVNVVGAGTVVIALTVEPGGTARDIVVARSSGSIRFDREALQLVRRAVPLPPPPTANPIASTSKSPATDRLVQKGSTIMAVTAFTNPRALKLAALVCIAMPGVGQAHTSYLLPKVFSANTEQMVTVESAFAEKFFRPEVPVDAKDYHVVLPDGSRGEFQSITPLKQLVILEAPLAQDGTYRFTTGVRLGRVGKSALIDGRWRPVHDQVPAGATKVRTSQTETVADVYVSKKKPTRAPVDASIGRLQIRPVTHPSELYLDTPFAVQVLFDGKPLQGQELVLDRGGADYEEALVHRQVTTDAKGGATFRFDRPGVYVLMTRHRAEAPAGSGTDERSYTTSLTFQVEE
jgi:TonB family protein